MGTMPTSPPSEDLPRSGSDRGRRRAPRPTSHPARDLTLRATAVAVLMLGWVGLTSTTGSDPSQARPGTRIAVAPLPDTLDRDSAPRRLNRLLVTAPWQSDSPRLYKALSTAGDRLGPEIPAEDDAEDQDAEPPADGVAAAEAGIELARTLAASAVGAPSGQAERLLTTAADVDDAARRTLRAHGAEEPEDSGVEAALSKAPDDLGKALKPVLADATCASGGVTDPAADVVDGFASDRAADAESTSQSVRRLHRAGADGGRLAYATRVVGQRNGSEALTERATDLDRITSTFQAVLPQDCAPLATTTAGATATLRDGGASLEKAQAAWVDRLRDAAAAVPSGNPRKALMALWWEQRSR